MSDLVERLLDLNDHYSTSGQLGPENRAIFAESAAELTRLTEQREKADEACQHLCNNHGFATGHGDTVADMIGEIDGQITRLTERVKELEKNPSPADYLKMARMWAAEKARAETAERERDEARAALKQILLVNDDFRAGLPQDWEGDPLQDACAAARAITEGK